MITATDSQGADHEAQLQERQGQRHDAQAQVITKALIAALLACLAGVGVQTWRIHSLEVKVAEAELALKTAEEEWATAKAEQEEAARKAEREHNEALNAIAARYEQEKADAEAQRERELAALRDGSVRLRKLWQGCEAAAGSVPGASAGPGESDAVAELRRQAASDLVRIGAQCDAHVRGLQQVIRAR